MPAYGMSVLFGARSNDATDLIVNKLLLRLALRQKGEEVDNTGVVVIELVTCDLINYDFLG